jgi:anti-anti-sigma factor
METTINTHSLANDDTIVVIHIAGSIDGSNSIDLENVFNEQVTKGNTKLVADVANVHYISSSGLRAFLGSMRASREQEGDLRIAAVQPNVAEVLEISGLAELFVFCDNVDEAVQSFNP